MSMRPINSWLLLPAFVAATWLAVPVAMADPPPSPHEPPKGPVVVHHEVTNKVVNVHRNVDVHRNVHVNRTVTVHRNVVVNRAEVTRPVAVEPRPIAVGPRPVGVAPHPARWARGGRFTGNRLVYNDWGRYHLQAPPPGYAWVQDDDELVLINLGSGVIGDTFVITIP